MEEDFVIVANHPEEEEQIEVDGKSIGVIDDAEEDMLDDGGGTRRESRGCLMSSLIR